jgi:beta-lactamase class A
MNFIKKRLWYVPVVFLLALPFIGWTLDWPLIREFREKQCRKSYHYLNTDLVCESAVTISKTGYLTTKNDVIAYAEKEYAAGRLIEVSVYFRDLRDGPAFGINESADFAPASLMKLPLVFAYFHMEEENPGFLEQKVLYTKEHSDIPDLVQSEPSGAKLIAEAEYSLEELLKNMVIYSDNDAYYALVEFINAMPDRAQQVLTTYEELGVVDPRTFEEEVISVRGYAALYRLLYNSSYLSALNSEKVLSWLAASAYGKGLEAGVPEGIVVANKFGERENKGVKQLHDCGVIYYPGNPYSLCVMTMGKDYAELAHVIAEISRIFYEEVDSRRLK